jgi:ribosomal-protein-alanine N-acetyltransferase
MNVSLRDMRVEDLDSVVALRRSLFPHDPCSREELSSELAAKRSPDGHRAFMVVAEDDQERVVGYSKLVTAAGTGHVWAIGVAGDQRGTGIGTRLYAHMMRIAADYGCREMLADVRVDNTPSLRLHRHCGFKPIGFRPGFYQPDDVDSVVMRRGLCGGRRGGLYYWLRRAVRFLRLNHRYGSRLRDTVAARMGLRDAGAVHWPGKAPTRHHSAAGQGHGEG